MTRDRLAAIGLTAALFTDALFRGRVFFDVLYDVREPLLASVYLGLAAVPLVLASWHSRDGHAEARLAAYVPDRVDLEVDLDRPGYAVLADAYTPGWSATVDGRDAPVLRANVAFRAVPVPAGRHRVELLYRPRSVIVGLAVSAFALVCGLGAAAVAARARLTSPQPSA